MSALLAGLTVLIIGDSHVTFKDSLLTLLPDAYVSAGAKVVTYGVCSSTAADWVVPNPNNGCGAAQRIGNAPVGDAVMKPTSPPPIASLLEKWHPNVVMVVLGDTMAAYGQSEMSKNWVDEQVKTLTSSLGDAACIWVGPTWGEFSPRYGKTDKRAQEMAGFLKTEVSPCTYVDGTQLMAQGSVKTIDGVHPTAASYRQWGDAILAQTMPMLEKLKKN
ncbi:SGNH/GDSL hydrolase family protein [Acetobacter vaccinii]|uniref:SGNH/GDSL hydrolase family protein n=1 Tax=Acetobacter vaccinii TaxID=2592655 RepID=A0A5C1YJH2_9PROT|nr:SGNH/GDSL hydrolase family protein [Acetobacter vaccinii]QEO16374.1 SGNH/GDSL hydrolase family protein [Acetobacter vaccinii]